MNRRRALKLMLATGTIASTGLSGRVALAQAKPFTLPPLGYPFEALEPHIDAQTMRIHHGNHHNAYVNNLNGLAEKWPELATRPMEQILAKLSDVPGGFRTGVRNNLGGHWNHTFFWDLMTPGGAKQPAGDLATAINGAFGDLAKMKAAVKQAGLAQFGSGWAWLGVDDDRKLKVFTTVNQDTRTCTATPPQSLASTCGSTPIISSTSPDAAITSTPGGIRSTGTRWRPTSRRRRANPVAYGAARPRRYDESRLTI